VNGRLFTFVVGAVEEVEVDLALEVELRQSGKRLMFRSASGKSPTVRSSRVDRPTTFS
jgi:hypothetical protein